MDDRNMSREDRERWLRDNIERAEWTTNRQYPDLVEFKLDGVLLAWIQRRPAYCDRGHWLGQIEFSPGNPIDAADLNTTYYMRRAVAKQELRDKLMWRVCKVRAE